MGKFSGFENGGFLKINQVVWSLEKGRKGDEIFIISVIFHEIFLESFEKDFEKSLKNG